MIHLEEYRRAVDARIEALCACVPEAYRPGFEEIIRSVFHWNTDNPGEWSHDDVFEATLLYETARSAYHALVEAHNHLREAELREVARLRGRVS